MTYFWPDGYPIEVQMTSDGVLLRLSWDWYTGLHEVERIKDYWLVDDWWVKPKVRMYYFVLTENGRAPIIFKDIQSATWLMQWLYD